MIDDFNGGHQPARRGVSARRPLQYSRRFSEGQSTAAHTGHHADKASAYSTPKASKATEADAIAAAWDDDGKDLRSAKLPDPTKNPLFAPRDKSVDDVIDAIEAADSDVSEDTDNKKDDKKSDGETRWQRMLAAVRGLSRKQWFVIASVFVLVCGSCTAAWALTKPADVADQAVASKPKPKPLPPPPPPVSPLTGVEVPDADTKRVVTAVMIENSTNARPQTGLQEAGVVYEAIAEYGITRFMALYQEAKPGNIGPVRSARPYYVDWSKTYDAPYAHVGGSPDALNKIRAEGVKDLDQFYNSQAYRRTTNRFAPHNVYTTMAQLNEVAAGKGWTTSTFTGLLRKKEAPAPAEKRTANKVDIAISSPTYNTHYDYDAGNNRYLRSMAGAPHLDADSKLQIAPKSLVVMATDYGLEPDGYHSKYRVTGTGSGFIFQDGTVTPVTWNRPDDKSQYTFTGADNKPVGLIPGQTWITVVGSPGAVTYAP